MDPELLLELSSELLPLVPPVADSLPLPEVLPVPEVPSSDLTVLVMSSEMRMTSFELVWAVAWGTAPGALENSFELNELLYTISELASGNTYFMKVFALQEGGVISESREI